MNKTAICLAIATIMVFTTSESLPFELRKAVPAKWFVDPVTQCRVHGGNEWTIEDSSANWDGKCMNGLAHGEGTLVWSAEGIQYLTETFSKESGLILSLGKRTGVVRNDQVQLTLLKCIDSYRSVRANLSTELNGTSSEVIRAVLSMAEQFAWTKCPYRTREGTIDRSNVNVDIYQNQTKIEHARSYPTSTWKDDGSRVWRGQYDPTSSAGSIWSKAVSYYRKEAKRRREIRELEERRLRETHEKEKKERLRTDLMNRFGVDEWIHVSAGKLHANPFLFEGKAVVVKGYLKQMRTRTLGVFSDANSIFGSTGLYIVSEIQNHASISTGGVVIFGRVIGNMELTTTEGEVLIPHLQFLGMYESLDVLLP